MAESPFRSSVEPIGHNVSQHFLEKKAPKILLLRAQLGLWWCAFGIMLPNSFGRESTRNPTAENPFISSVEPIGHNVSKHLWKRQRQQFKGLGPTYILLEPIWNNVTKSIWKSVVDGGRLEIRFVCYRRIRVKAAFLFGPQVYSDVVSCILFFLC